MVNAVLSSKDHSGQVAELKRRIIGQAKMIELAENIIGAYDDKGAGATDDGAYIRAVDEALDYLWSINPEDKMASEPERAADKMLWKMWRYCVPDERRHTEKMPRTGCRDALVRIKAEAERRLLRDCRMLASRIGYAGEMDAFMQQCGRLGVHLQLIHGKGGA